ncbi:hypothetical protein KC19_8G183000 [Ceratodon purpureus]|uniref:DUF7748 domain-containing protein n=1 Tax=Ceratodon purpureus TaxID=3225 RepID=A0A8T0H3K0_CERPU|nr:hypothetical protein KC19_8G183000 [Ceratodon purpureus]
MTTITVLRNATKGTVVLREGQVGVLRRVCEIPAGETHKVRSNLTATYKEYWCALQPSSNDDKFILTSDDCIDWREIEIITTDDTVGKKFLWKGVVPAKGTSKSDNTGTQSDSGSPSSQSAGASTFLSRLRSSRLFGWVFKHKPLGTAPATSSTSHADTAL